MILPGISWWTIEIVNTCRDRIRCISPNQWLWHTNISRFVIRSASSRVSETLFEMSRRLWQAAGNANAYNCNLFMEKVNKCVNFDFPSIINVANEWINTKKKYESSISLRYALQTHTILFRSIAGVESTAISFLFSYLGSRCTQQRKRKRKRRKQIQIVMVITRQ